MVSLSASGHAVPVASLERLGKAIAKGNSNLVRLAVGDCQMGDAGVVAICQGLQQHTAQEQEEQQPSQQSCRGDNKIQFLDLAWKNL